MRPRVSHSLAPQGRSSLKLTGPAMTPSAALAPLSPAPARPQGPFFVLDEPAFLARFNTRACFVQHRLVGHPLLELPRLLELAGWLPPKYVRINSGNLPIYATPDEIPTKGLSPEES